MVYEEVVLDMRQANRVPPDAHPRDGLVLQPQSALSGPDGRADRDAQPGADDRGTLVDRPAGAVRPRHRRVWRRGFLRLLDAGDVRRPAGAHLPGRADLPDLLSPDRGDFVEYQSSKYQNNNDIQPSLLYQELNPQARCEDAQLQLNFGSEP